LVGDYRLTHLRWVQLLGGCQQVLSDFWSTSGNLWWRCEVSFQVNQVFFFFSFFLSFFLWMRYISGWVFACWNSSFGFAFGIFSF